MKPKPCKCGRTPKAEVYRVAEDLMEARVKCTCGVTGPVIEHVWGGQEAKDQAIDAWNCER